MSVKFLDSNVILRYLLDDPEATSVETLLRSRQKLVLLDIVFTEVVWTLIRFYKWDKDRVISLTSGLLNLQSIYANKKLLLKSIELYRKSNIKYTDAYIAASMIERKEKKIYSFDKDFDKIAGPPFQATRLSL